MTGMLTILVVCLAGFTQGLTGFGFGLVAMPLLLLLQINLKEASALTVLLNLIVCGMTFFSTRRHYSFRLGLGLVVGSCLGVPLGIYALVRLDEGLLIHFLGGVMILMAANELILARVLPVRISPHLGIPMGLISGGLTGAFNMGGPPAVAYAYSQPWTKEQIVAVLQVVFGLSTLLRLVLLGGTGFMITPLLITGLWSIVPLMLFIALGQKYFSRISQPLLKQATFLFLGAMGIKYCFFSNM